jgi:hypothetical protein
MARQKKLSKAQVEREAARILALPAIQAALAQAKEQAEFEQKVQQHTDYEMQRRARVRAENEAAYPPGYLFTRDTMGIEPVPGKTDRWRRRRGRKRGTTGKGRTPDRSPEAFEKLLTEWPNATNETLAEKAGLSVATIYRYRNRAKKHPPSK